MGGEILSAFFLHFPLTFTLDQKNAFFVLIHAARELFNKRLAVCFNKLVMQLSSSVTLIKMLGQQFTTRGLLIKDKFIAV